MRNRRWPLKARTSKTKGDGPSKPLHPRLKFVIHIYTYTYIHTNIHSAYTYTHTYTIVSEQLSRKRVVSDFGSDNCIRKLSMRLNKLWCNRGQIPWFWKSKIDLKILKHLKHYRKSETTVQKTSYTVPSARTLEPWRANKSQHKSDHRRRP